MNSSMATLLEILRDWTAGWTRRPLAAEAAIEAPSANCDFELPPEYLCFLRYSNGGEGFLCIAPWYFQLCSAEEVIAHNQGYNVEEFPPGWFAIGPSRYPRSSARSRRSCRESCVDSALACN
jgi:hypothetical protein